MPDSTIYVVIIFTFIAECVKLDCFCEIHGNCTRNHASGRLCSFISVWSLITLGMGHLILFLTECNGLVCDVDQCVSRDGICDGVPDCADMADEEQSRCNPRESVGKYCRITFIVSSFVLCELPWIREKACKNCRSMVVWNTQPYGFSPMGWSRVKVTPKHNACHLRQHVAILGMRMQELRPLVTVGVWKLRFLPAHRLHAQSKLRLNFCSPLPPMVLSYIFIRQNNKHYSLNQPI